jgi:hypothetical protein
VSAPTLAFWISVGGGLFAAPSGWSSSAAWNLHAETARLEARHEGDAGTAVATEEYPYDEAAFRSATTASRRSDSALGWKAGAAVAWSVASRLDLGAEARYVGAEAEIDQPEAGPPASRREGSRAPSSCACASSARPRRRRGG